MSKAYSARRKRERQLANERRCTATTNAQGLEVPFISRCVKPKGNHKHKDKHGYEWADGGT